MSKRQKKRARKAHNKITRNNTQAKIKIFPIFKEKKAREDAEESVTRNVSVSSSEELNKESPEVELREVTERQTKEKLVDRKDLLYGPCSPTTTDGTKPEVGKINLAKSGPARSPWERQTRS